MRKKMCCCLLMLAMLTGILTGCGSGKESQFRSYIQSLITANYLGTSDEYIKTTGANQSDAEALYLQNTSRLADNLITYYGLDIANDPEAVERVTEVSKKIYNMIRYEVAPARMDNGIYYVDVTLHPINILNDTHEAVVAFIGEFNKRVSAGEFNKYSKEEYQRELTNGIMDILEEGTKNMTYQDPKIVTVRIIEGKSTFYISDDDLRSIDELVIATLSDDADSKTDPKDPADPGSPDTTEEGTTEKSWG